MGALGGGHVGYGSIFHQHQSIYIVIRRALSLVRKVHLPPGGWPFLTCRVSETTGSQRTPIDGSLFLPALLPDGTRAFTGCCHHSHLPACISAARWFSGRSAPSSYRPLPGDEFSRRYGLCASRPISARGAAPDIHEIRRERSPYSADISAGRPVGDNRRCGQCPPSPVSALIRHY